MSDYSYFTTRIRGKGREMEITPRKQPRQARARATCAAIREAAARILVAGGAAAVNTNAVAELAGVSVGTLYQYYPSKEAILAELVREMRAGMLDDLRKGASEAGNMELAASVRVMTAAALEHHRRDAALADALERVEADLPLDAETAALKREIHMLVVAILDRHGVADAGVAAQDLSAISRGMAEAAAAAGERDFDAVGRRVARAAIGYLMTP